MNAPKDEVMWQSLGYMPYDQALDIQQARGRDLLAQLDDVQTVYCVEHPPTITIGRNGTFSHIVASREEIERIGFAIHEVDRGGDVTYHGPGQIVLYPVLHLSPWDNDVGGYVRRLEQVAIDVLAEVGIAASRLEGYPGAWVGEQKICAIGVRMKRRQTGEFVTTHGLALNVNPDLSHFGAIVPCGIVDKGVTSVSQLLSQQLTVRSFEDSLKRAFARVFDVSITSASTKD